MPALFSQYVAKHEGFFSEGFVHDDCHMFFNTKWKNLRFGVTVDDEKTWLKAAWMQKFDLSGFKVAAKFRATQEGTHTIKLKNRGNFGEKNKYKVVNVYDYDQNAETHTNTFKIKTYWEEIAAKHRISFTCTKGSCNITNAVSKKICENTIVAGNFTVDQKATPVDYNWGVFWNKKWLNMGITKHHDFTSEEACAIKDFHANSTMIGKILTHGGFNWRLLMDANKDL